MKSIRVHLLGPLDIGGHSRPRPGLDRATARRRLPGGADVPFFPGTALRGALRIELERLLRGLGREPCDPLARGTEHCACLACILFGHPLREGVVRVGDALPEDPTAAAGWFSTRPGVSVSRHTGSAESGRLFFAEVVAPMGSDGGLTFRAAIQYSRPLQADEEHMLRAACEAVQAIGSGKARGLGAVRLEPLEEPADSSDSLPAPGLAGCSRARLVLRLLEPVHVASQGGSAFFQEGLDHVPGSTLRGAFATYLARGSIDPASETFRAAFLDRDALRFGPARVLLDDGGRQLLFRPATGYRCRVNPQHRLGDQLARTFLVSRLAEAGRDAPLLGCPQCGAIGKIESEESFARPRRRVITRVAVDRSTGAAAPGQLYSATWLEPGQTLVAEVRAPDPSRLVALEHVHGGILRLGRGRNRGGGSARVTLAPLGSCDPAEARMTRFSDALVRMAGDLGALDLLDATRCYFPVDLVSDWVPSPPLRLAPDPLADGDEPVPGARLELRIVRAARASGFHSRGGVPRGFEPAVAAGSAFVYSVPRSALDQASTGLARLALRGVGLRVKEGFGAIEVAHAGHLDRMEDEA